MLKNFSIDGAAGDNDVANITFTVIFDENGRDWYEAKEVAIYFHGKEKYKQAIERCMEKDEQKFYSEIKCKYKPKKNFLSDTLFIEESGVYGLVLESNLEIAIKFQNWVYGEVVPTFITKGKYFSKQIRSKNEIFRMIDRSREKCKI